MIKVSLCTVDIYSKNVFCFFFQESPTGELVDYAFSMEEESNEYEASEQMTSDNEMQEDPETQVEVDARSCETFCESGKTCEINSEQGQFVKTETFP